MHFAPQFVKYLLLGFCVWREKMSKRSSSSPLVWGLAFPSKPSVFPLGPQAAQGSLLAGLRQ